MDKTIPISASNHPHRRYNPLNGQWVLVSPHRTQRPWLGQVDDTLAALSTPHDPHCHLCAGNVRANGTKNPAYDGVYVFDNDFPAVQREQHDAEQGTDPFFISEPASGVCRVICFSSDHAQTLPELPISAVRAIIDCWAEQSADLGKDHAWVQLFENKGAMMGCSNPHPHGQIWATHHIPDEILTEDKYQRAYYENNDSPMLFDLAERESARGERVVVKNEHWVAIVPYWASWPFETLVLPRFKVARLDALNAEQRDALAMTLKELTARYDNLFHCSFPYSMGWHGAPFRSGPQDHWQLHAHFYPPLLRSATIRKFMVGYELMAEPQRDLTPEQAAAQLRAVSPHHYSLEKAEL
ncbi:MAG: UDP-glucose--hexose-1-phosphate uridylyltransferase [Chakrabartia sp.]